MTYSKLRQSRPPQQLLSWWWCWWRPRPPTLRKALIPTFLALISTGLILFMYFLVETDWYWFPTVTELQSRRRHVRPYLKHGNNTTKLILLWTKSWSSGRTHPINGWDIDDQTLAECPVRCDFTDDKDLLDLSDALVYHGVNWEAWNIFGLPDLPKQRPNPEQIWTFLRIESPANQPHDFSKFDGLFNWTATYRLDSDIPFLYGSFENITAATAAKTKELTAPPYDKRQSQSLVGWMVSNCNVQSKRHLLVEKLQKYIPVDIFGSCSPSGARLECSEDDCYSELAKKYKFWLAFEKSLCADYLSEKFYLPLYHGMVPILYAHQSVLRLIPNGSFINVNDFSSMEDLAKYLIYLDANPEEYRKYFEWKKYLRVNRVYNDKFWCAFCTKLHGVGSSTISEFGVGAKDSPKLLGAYPSIDKWFYYNNTEDTYQCVEPTGPLFDTE